jgi:hypothetical protein
VSPSVSSGEGTPPVDTDEHVKGYRTTSDEAWDRWPICQSCGMAWPCDVSVLAARVGSLEAEVEGLRDEITTALRDYGTTMIAESELVERLSALAAVPAPPSTQGPQAKDGKRCPNRTCTYPEGMCELEEVNIGAFDHHDYVDFGHRHSDACLRIREDDR